jgi:ADP-ribosyl-[dinitrogen reductase] hydrolase
MAVDGKVFDIGIQTGAALNRLMSGASPSRSGLSGERNNGNGSLMRSLPLALLHRGDDRSLTDLAHAQSLVTHAHPRSQACCALYVLWARFEIERHPSPWDAAVESLRSIYELKPEHLTELNDVILRSTAASGSGYVVDSLHSARKACEEKSYVEIVRAAIALGNDTDTTACIAGGIAGIRHGKSGMPGNWIESLRGVEILLCLLERIRREPPDATAHG